MAITNAGCLLGSGSGWSSSWLRQQATMPARRTGYTATLLHPPALQLAGALLPVLSAFYDRTLTEQTCPSPMFPTSLTQICTDAIKAGFGMWSAKVVSQL